MKTIVDNGLELILERLVEKINDKTIIEGGHFLIEQDENGNINQCTNPESTMTWNLAVEIYSRAKKKGEDVSLSFLIDDLSIDPEKRKEYNDNFRLPKLYLDILEEKGISPAETIYFNESRLRNRSDNRLKKAIKNNLVVDSAGAYRLNLNVFGVFNDDAVSSSNDNSSKRVPNCRLMLGQELQDKELMGYRMAINFCNQVVYKCRGRFAVVYQTILDGKMDVINVYLRNSSRNGIEVDLQEYKSTRLPTSRKSNGKSII
jgi:hypothetical protein